jgi:hypothetical protein
MRYVRTRPVNGRSANLRFPFGMRNKSDMKQETTSMMTFPEPAGAASGRSGSASLLTGQKRGRGGRAAALTSTLVAMMAVIVAMASPARALDLADIDGAMPGPTAWWAGTCDRASAPAPGEPVPANGVGTMPATGPDGFSPAPAVPSHCIDIGIFTNPLFFPTPSYPSPWLVEPQWRLASAPAAGAHPDATASFAFPVKPRGAENDQPVGAAKTTLVDVPPGVIGDPLAVAQCPQESFAASPHRCHPSAQVGLSSITLLACATGAAQCGNSTDTYPVFSLEPRKGFTAEFGIADIPGLTYGGVSIRIFAKARTDGDFGVTAGVMAIPTQFPLIAQTLTFWGVPFGPANDEWRPTDGKTVPAGGLPVERRASYDPSWGTVKPFFSNPTECDGRQPVTWLTFDSYEEPAALLPNGSTPDGKPDLSDSRWTRTGSAADPVADCAAPPFDPRATVAPGATAADAPAGLSVDIDIPANDDAPLDVATDAAAAAAHWASPAGRATSHLDKTVVELPEGMSVNPSAATGLVACSNAQVGVTDASTNPLLFNNEDPFDDQGAECPDGSAIGTVTASTPLLNGPLTGQMVLGTPESTDPTSGRMFRMFLVLRNEDRGVIAKVHGTAIADPSSGRITATFDKNPRVLVEDIQVDVKGGERGVLAMPQTCNTEPDEYQSVSSFTPWSRSHLPEGEGPGTQDPVDITQNWTVDENCAYDFNPGLKAGMSNAGAREGGTFGFEFTRPQGDQTLKGLTAELPTGLLATVKDLPLCKDAQAAAGNCPAASRIGLVDASAGSGDPFVLEQKGEVFLTEGYKGGPYGLMVKVRAIAGPFRGAMELSPIVVRQKIEVDPATAQVRAISDPFPTIHHGVPLRVRRVLVNVDRPNFMINPSDCSAKQVKATLTSVEGTVAGRANHFQSSDCASLAFKPKLGLRLTGRKQVRTGKHPGIRAVVTQKGVSEAGIKKAEVRLPKSLALDVNNAGALCEFVDGTKPDLERHCPKGSIVGRSRATSPLLDRPLVGNVYFVKNVRRDPKTGNEIRTLPMIIVALRGEISINLRGESAVDNRNRLVSTFAAVPDAPVSKFNLNIRGGGKGIIAVTRTRRALINLCARPKSHVAESDMDGFNGRRHDNDIRMKTPCNKRQTKAAKRAAKKAAKRAAAARHRRS